MDRPHVGKRGRFLLFLALLDVVYSFSLAVPGEATRATAQFIWLASIAPLWAWSAAWGAVAVILLWQAFSRRDIIGYAAAWALKVGWGVVSLGGWLFGDVERGYVAAAIFLVFAWIVGVIAGWAEPGDVRGLMWKRPPSSPSSQP